MAKRKRWDNCGLCGRYMITTREHVIPRSFYPPSKAGSKVQRITISACAACNNGTADDDAHFRFVVALAGEANPAVQELWEGPMRRSFSQVDALRRVKDVVKLLRPATDVGPDRFRIYPAEDERVLRSIRKVVRGLSWYHHRTVIPDIQVIADVLRAPLPSEIASEMAYFTAEPDICDYAYLSYEIESARGAIWLLRFYERTTFVAYVTQGKEIP